MFFQKYKKIILIIAVLLIALLGYSLLSEPKETETLLVSTNQVTQSQVVGNEIISALNQIQTLNLSSDIFSDPVFRSLIDRSTPIPDEPVGKSNPFSPIGSDAQVQNTRATSTPSTNTIINTTNRPTQSQPVI